MCEKQQYEGSGNQLEKKKCMLNTVLCFERFDLVCFTFLDSAKYICNIYTEVKKKCHTVKIYELCPDLMDSQPVIYR